jgi:hypothetical protein
MHDAPHRAVARRHAALAQLHHHGPQRQIRNRFKPRQQPIPLRRQRPRLSPTQRLRRRAPRRPKPPRPPHHARDAHPEHRRHRAARATAQNRRRNPLPQIIRIRSRHSMLTSATASILNQNSTPQGIPNRVKPNESDSNSCSGRSAAQWPNSRNKFRELGGGWYCPALRLSAYARRRLSNSSTQPVLAQKNRRSASALKQDSGSRCRRTDSKPFKFQTWIVGWRKGVRRPPEISGRAGLPPDRGNAQSWMIHSMTYS